MRVVFPGLALLCLGACTQPGDVSIAKDLKTKYIVTTDVRDMSSEKLPLPARGAALGAQAGLAGPTEAVKAQLDGAALITGPIPFPAAETALASLRDQLLSQWKLQPLPVVPAIEVTASRQYTAESLSDDTVQVSYGVLRRARSDDELAFVVGHELGHLLLQHQLRRERAVNEAREVSAGVAMASMLAVAYATGHRTGTTITLQAGPTAAAAGGGVAGNTAVAEILTTLVDPGWSSRQEEQADLIGIDLAAAAGYNPASATDTFDSVIADEKVAAAKAEELRQQMAAQPKPKSTGMSFSGWLSDAWDSADAKLRQLQTNHPDTGKREDAAAKYRDAFYTTEQSRPTQTGVLDDLQRSRQFRNIGDAIDAAYSARDAIAQKDYADALRYAIKAQRLARGWWAPLYVGGIAFVESGQTRRGLALLMAATKAQHAPYPVYERAALEFARADQLSAALQIMDSADATFGNPELTYPDRITLYRNAGDETQASAEHDKCIKSDRSAVRDACSTAASKPVENKQSAG